MLAEITPVITYNEALTCSAPLQALKWARRVVILDSGSTDESKAIASGFANVIGSSAPSTTMLDSAISP